MFCRPQVQFQNFFGPVTKRLLDTGAPSMLPATLVVLALAAAAADTCQPDWVYSFGLKPRWELPRGSCLPAFTTFGEFIRATDFEDDRDPAKARAAGHRLPPPHNHPHSPCPVPKMRLCVATGMRARPLSRLPSRHLLTSCLATCCALVHFPLAGVGAAPLPAARVRGAVAGRAVHAGGGARPMTAAVYIDIPFIHCPAAQNARDGSTSC